MGGQGQSCKAVGFSSKKPQPRRFGSKRLWTNRAERLPWVTRPKKGPFPCVAGWKMLRGFGAIKRKCLDDQGPAFCRKVSYLELGKTTTVWCSLPLMTYQNNGYRGNILRSLRVRVFSGSLCRSRSVTSDLLNYQIEGSQGLFLRRRALVPMIFSDLFAPERWFPEFIMSWRDI